MDECPDVPDHEEAAAPVLMHAIPVLPPQDPRALQQPRAPEELAELRLLGEPTVRQLVGLLGPGGVKEKVRHEALCVASLG